MLDAYLFLFKFASKRDKQRILEGSSWSFDKHLVVFQEYDGNISPAQHSFDKACFQIRVYGIPLGMMNAEVEKWIESKLCKNHDTNNNASMFAWGGV